MGKAKNVSESGADKQGNLSGPGHEASRAAPGVSRRGARGAARGAKSELPEGPPLWAKVRPSRVYAEKRSMTSRGLDTGVKTTWAA
jgi:hypothetical protein